MFVVKCHEDGIEAVIKAHFFHTDRPAEGERRRLGPVRAAHIITAPGV